MQLYLYRLFALYLGLTPLLVVAQSPDRSAFSLNLSHPTVEALLGSFQQQLHTLLEAAQYVRDDRSNSDASAPSASITTLDAAMARMADHEGVIYVILGDRGSNPEQVEVGDILVVPDVVRLTIRQEATTAPAPSRRQTPPSQTTVDPEVHVPPKGVEVRLIESEHGDPPMFEITIDGDQLEQ